MRRVRTYARLLRQVIGSDRIANVRWYDAVDDQLPGSAR